MVLCREHLVCCGNSCAVVVCVKWSSNVLCLRVCVCVSVQILFLNKVDLFRSKIMNSERHLRTYFPQYQGVCCVLACVRVCMFVQLCACVYTPGLALTHPIYVEVLLYTTSFCCLSRALQVPTVMLTRPESSLRASSRRATTTKTRSSMPTSQRPQTQATSRLCSRWCLRPSSGRIWRQRSSSEPALC